MMTDNKGSNQGASGAGFPAFGGDAGLPKLPPLLKGKGVSGASLPGQGVDASGQAPVGLTPTLQAPQAPSSSQQNMALPPMGGAAQGAVAGGSASYRGVSQQLPPATGLGMPNFSPQPVGPGAPNLSPQPVGPGAPNLSPQPVGPGAPNLSPQPVGPGVPNFSPQPVGPGAPNLSPQPVGPGAPNLSPQPVGPGAPNFSPQPVGPGAPNLSPQPVGPNFAGKANLAPQDTMAMQAPQPSPNNADVAKFEAVLSQVEPNAGSAPSFNSVQPVVNHGAAPQVSQHGGGAESAPVTNSSETSQESDWEEGGDLGEKTMMLDAPSEEDLGDLDGEKTQINMSAMDYEPLFGKLVVESGKAPQREYILVRDVTTIGRGTKNEIIIPDISMSRNHAAIDKFKEGFRLRDLDSGNGSVVNNYRIRVAQLRNGDSVEIGSVRFRFEQNGGDPDELWRGEAKVEYHPNQKRSGVAAAVQPAPAPAGPMPGAALSAGPSYYPTAQPSPMGAAMEPQPAMESMLQRPGGVAAPSWSDPSLGQPYGQSMPYATPYGGAQVNALRSMRKPALWVMVLFVVALIGFFTTGIILLTSIVKRQGTNAELQARTEKWATVEKSVQEGAVAFSNKQFKEARNAFQQVQNLDKDNALVPIYLEKITKEEEVELLLQTVRQKLQNRSITMQELEDAMLSYQKVSQASPYYHDIRMSYLPDIQARYVRKLKEEIRDKISADAFSQAASLIVKLGKMEGSANDVSSLAKLVEDKQSQMKR